MTCMKLQDRVGEILKQCWRNCKIINARPDLYKSDTLIQRMVYKLILLRLKVSKHGLYLWMYLDCKSFLDLLHITGNLWWIFLKLQGQKNSWPDGSISYQSITLKLITGQGRCMLMPTVCLLGYLVNSMALKVILSVMMCSYQGNK